MLGTAGLFRDAHVWLSYRIPSLENTLHGPTCFQIFIVATPPGDINIVQGGRSLCADRSCTCVLFLFCPLSDVCHIASAYHFPFILCLLPLSISSERWELNCCFSPELICSPRFNFREREKGQKAAASF